MGSKATPSMPPPSSVTSILNRRDTAEIEQDHRVH